MPTQPQLRISTVVARTPKVIDAEVDGEVVALNIDDGACYGLNGVGSRIWRLVEAPVRIADVCTILRAEYSVDQDTCEQQVLEMLEGLRSEGLIAVCDAPPAAGA